MGKAKPVTINGKGFESKKKAVIYFMDKRFEFKEKRFVDEEIFFEELKDLYTRYCKYCSGWELNGREIIAFIIESERRKNKNNWIESLCYKVKFSNNEIRPFSVSEALKVIIDNES